MGNKINKVENSICMIENVPNIIILLVCNYLNRKEIEFLFQTSKTMRDKVMYYKIHKYYLNIKYILTIKNGIIKNNIINRYSKFKKIYTGNYIVHRIYDNFLNFFTNLTELEFSYHSYGDINMFGKLRMIIMNDSCDCKDINILKNLENVINIEIKDGIRITNIKYIFPNVKKISMRYADILEITYFPNIEYLELIGNYYLCEIEDDLKHLTVILTKLKKLKIINDNLTTRKNDAIRFFEKMNFLYTFEIEYYQEEYYKGQYPQIKI